MKTTIYGSLTILAALINAAIAIMNGGSLDIVTTITAITAGIGLIKAADSK
jgi:hypothetical protein